MVGGVLFGVFFLLLLTGAPITMCMGIATLVALFTGGYALEVLPEIVAQRRAMSPLWEDYLKGLGEK